MPFLWTAGALTLSGWASLALCIGCTGGTSNQATSLTQDDGAAVAAPPADIDVTSEADQPRVDDGAADSGDALETLGQACAAHDGCGPSGWCVDGPDGPVCSRECIDQCPTGWACRLVDVAGADVLTVCVPADHAVCKRCSGPQECGGVATCGMDSQTPSGSAGACLLPCEGPNWPCPPSFACQPTAILPSLDTAWLCAPAAGRPCCSASTAGTTTPCSRSNDVGSCAGTSECRGREGWSPCLAPLPSEEVCDGQDNQCNGATDEGLSDACRCGDGACAPSAGEDARTCPKDCAACGDGVCSPGESPVVCPVDCCSGGSGGAGCGDGRCLGYGCMEGPDNCPQDCGQPCGNGDCERGETPYSCPDDCRHQVCGNGVCEPTDGGPDECPLDCSSACGDCVCAGDEDFQSCPIDCGSCGDGVCSYCGLMGETERCAADCDQAAGNEACNGLDDDGDGTTDEQGAIDCVVYFRDDDEDGFGDDADVRCLCSGESPYTAVAGGDCDDAETGVHPLGEERCDGADNDCDGATDESLCDDEDSCTIDRCDASSADCVHAPAADGTGCDDGNACTGNDSCGDGRCQPGPALSCVDDNPCSVDGCVPASGCVFPNVQDGAECDDANVCTHSDACAGGRCVGQTVDCDDDWPCSADSCHLLDGCRHTTCDDGDLCTSDSCDVDGCRHVPLALPGCPDRACLPADLDTTWLGVSSLRGRQTDFIMVGDTAWLTTHAGLFGLNADDPSSLSLEWALVEHGPFDGAAASGELAVAWRDRTGTVQVYSVRTGRPPHLEDTFALEYTFSTALLHDDHLWLGYTGGFDTDPRVEVYDLTNPSNAQFAGTLPVADPATGGTAINLAPLPDGMVGLHGGSLDGAGSARILGRQRPDPPTVVYELDAHAAAMAHGERYLYLLGDVEDAQGAESRRLAVLDLEASDGPRLERSIPLGWRPTRLDLIGDELLLRGRSGAAYWDLTEPSRPAPGDTLATFTSDESLSWIDPKRIVLLDDEDGLWIADHAAVRRTGDLSGWSYPSSAGSVHHISAHREFMLVADGPGGLEIRQRTEAGELVGHLGSVNAQSVLAIGDRAYLAAGPAGLAIVDIAEPTSPNLLSTTSLPSPNPFNTAETSAVDLVQGRGHLFVANSSGLAIVDVRVPGVPRLISSVDLPGAIREVVVEGSLAILLESPSTPEFSSFFGGKPDLFPVDVSDLATPRRLPAVALDASGAWSMRRRGDRLLLLGSIDESGPLLTTDRQPVHWDLPLFALPTSAEPQSWSSVHAHGFEFTEDLVFERGLSGIGISQRREAPRRVELAVPHASTAMSIQPGRIWLGVGPAGAVLVDFTCP